MEHAPDSDTEQIRPLDSAKIDGVMGQVTSSTDWADLSLIWVMEFSPPNERLGLRQKHPKSAPKVLKVSARKLDNF